MRLEGKVALITGGARGIGAAEVRLFAKEGARVGIADVLEEEGRRLAAEITASGGQATFIKLNVTREDEWKHAVDVLVRSFGKLDVLVNNAGIVRVHSLEEATVEDWDETLEVNAKGVFLGTKAVIPAMRQAGGGSIVNISSVAALVAHVGLAPYSAAKSAVRMLTKCTAVEHAKDGIRANSVHPGPIDTEMTRPALERPGVADRVVQLIPMGRIGRPQDVANGVLFLATDESSYITGTELVIDGGFTAFR